MTRIASLRIAAGSVLQKFSWGIVDQVFSSATNLTLTLVAARVLGPAGLGRIFIGFSAYLAMLGLQRALLAEPLTIYATNLVRGERNRVTRCGITLGLSAAAAASLLFLLIGTLVPGGIGDGLLLFAPWVGVALFQDLCRHLLFRDTRGRAAAGNDVTWAVIMAIGIAST
ncbi:MAG: hypothetical protein ACRD1T_17535, partial [Acidimicrobiia bacterium]